MKFSDKTYIRPDVIFSNWIFLLAIIYFLGFKKYNPLLLLLVGLFQNTMLFFVLYVKLKEHKWAWLLFFVNFLIKIVPIFFLRNTSIVWSDAYFSLAYFFLFLAYINILYFGFHIHTAYSMFNYKQIRPGIFAFYIDKLLYSFFHDSIRK